MFQSQRGSEGSTTKGFKYFVESISPLMNDDVIFGGDILKRCRNERQQGNFEEILAKLVYITQLV